MTLPLLTRSAPEVLLEVRATPVAGMDEDQRTITGVAVPFGQATSSPGYYEEFARGAFPDGAEATLHVNHSGQTGALPVGKLVGRNTDRGYEITATVARTARGDEVLQLVREGVLRHFSVGFVPVAHEMRGDTVVRTKAELREVSIVERAAYSGAVIETIRSATTPAPTPNPATEETRMTLEEFEKLMAESSAVAEMRSQLAEQEQRIAAGGVADKLPESGQFRTANGGEFLKGLLRGDQEVRDEYTAAVESLEARAYAGQETADTVMRPAWIDKILRLTEDRRPMSNLFSKETLPETGNSFEYPVVKTETGTMKEQIAEGDDLAYLEVQIGTANATVRTVGGYTSLSRQLIERASVAHLDTTLRYMAIQYADLYEAYVRSFFAGLAGVNTITAAAKPASAADWISAVYDAAVAIEDNAKGLEAEFIVVSRDLAKEIALITDTTGRPVFTANRDGANTWGDLAINKQHIVGSIAQLPVITVPKLAAGTIKVCSSAAIASMESAGAPVRLQDENIINLTRDFSMYGYQAIYSEQPKGISAITWTP